MNAANTERGLLMALTAVLAGFGVLMVYSASITSWPSHFERVYLSRHLVFLSLGGAAAAVAAHLPATFWRRFAPPLFGITLLLLGLVLIPGVGVSVNGARRWLRFGPLSVQPAELAKVALPLLLAKLLCREERKDASLPFFAPLIPVAVTAGLVLVEPDLGTAVFLALGAGVALFAAGWPLRRFVFCAAVLLPVMLSLVSLRPYQWRRITGFLEAWSNWREAPYQLRQSLYALGSGGTQGTGLGRGWQKLSFLPEANTDFVFAVVGEELGLLGTLGVLGLWCGFLVAGVRLLGRLPVRSFGNIAGLTLVAQLFLQAALNMAVVTGLVPPKGIPHPFLSSGGSNLVVSLLAVGIVLSLSREAANSGGETGSGIVLPVSAGVWKSTEEN